VLNAPDGSAVSATLWTFDADRDMVSFSAVPNDPQLRALIECDEAVVVGHLDSVKLQFDVNDLVLVHGGKSSALHAQFPREMFRFQRRNGFRVPPLARSTPVARLRHPMIPDMQLSLRVLDVSIGGCALFLPDDVPPLDPGVLMNGAQIDLDADTRVKCSLRLQHVTSINPESRGVRLGCEMVNAGSDGLRALQLYIDQTQKRRRLLDRG
jgi:c-di-GMP-binding flagellar brake protein YcgR